SGSAGVDLETEVETTLWDTQVLCVPTKVHGPLGNGLSALLLGRTSTTKKGLFVLPGVIDADFTGQIKIMVWTPSPPVNIPAASRIAQLVPFKAQVPHALSQERGDSSFGSIGQPEVFLTLDITKWKPTIRLTFEQPYCHHPKDCTLEVLIDTGADVTIIS
ncbi:POK9 protein, partial [Caloenas nicobarica]|nr:POK9 protein [Caloenas nicobarica]